MSLRFCAHINKLFTETANFKERIAVAANQGFKVSSMTKNIHDERAGKPVFTFLTLIRRLMNH